jgi:hypothetical protein
MPVCQVVRKAIGMGGRACPSAGKNYLLVSEQGRARETDRVRLIANAA